MKTGLESEAEANKRSEDNFREEDPRGPEEDKQTIRKKKVI